MRGVLLVLGLCCMAAGADKPSVPLRGKLVQHEGQPPTIQRDGAIIRLSGDEPTLRVLNDERLRDSDFEALGHFTGPAEFEVNHIHMKSLFVYQQGKRLQVSYWCDVCYIRTSSPGKCWCCQKYTDLDPVEPEN